MAFDSISPTHGAPAECRASYKLLRTAFKAATRGRTSIAVRALCAARARDLASSLDLALIESLEVEFRSPDPRRLTLLAQAVEAGWRDAGAPTDSRRHGAGPSGEPAAPHHDAHVSGLRDAVFRFRNLLAGAPLLFALRSTQWEWEGDRWVWAGAASLALAGLSLRSWASAHHGYEQRRGKPLVVDGPYAWVRNPLYLGNLLLIAAGIVASELLWLLPIALAWGFAVYDRMVRYEETRLKARFGSAYAYYCARTLRWIPRRPQRAATWVPGFRHAMLAEAHCALVLLPFALKEWSLF